MAADVAWICREGRHGFKVRAMVHRSAIEDHRKVQCPKCGGWDTGPAKTTDYNKPRVTHAPVAGPDKMLEPPTLPQLCLINKLGGDPKSVKNKGEAGQLIAKLKKEQGGR